MTSPTSIWIFSKQLNLTGSRSSAARWAAGSRWRWRCATPRASSRWCWSVPRASPRPGVLPADIFLMPPEELVRNLFVDQKLVQARLVGAGETSIEDAEEPPHHRAPRLGAAAARSAPAEVAAPHRRAGEDHLGQAGPHPAGGHPRRAEAAACPARSPWCWRTAATCRTPRRSTSSSTSYAIAR